MRATKFRGKFEGTWWYVRVSNDHVSSSWEQFWALVDRETVGEYVGDKDKSGKDIYEGDIIRRGYFALNDVSKFGLEPWLHLPEGVKESDITTIIETWAVASDIAGWQKISEAVRSSPDVLGVEIIGNIYDNPDLMFGAGFVR